MSKKAYKYLAVADALEKKIRNGEYKPETQLPTERELSKIFKVALLTMRQTLLSLEKKQIIRREHGRGTFVNDPKKVPETPLEGSSLLKTVSLIGINENISAATEPANWKLILVRYQGIIEGGYEFGYKIKTIDGEYASEKKKLLNQLKNSHGVILVDPPKNKKIFDTIKGAGLPVVGINLFQDSPACSEVQIDSRLGAFQAVEHLVKLGHQRIGIIIGDQSKASMKMRLDGYKDALSKHGIPYEPELTVIESTGLSENAKEACDKLLKLKKRPTAIFTGSDRRALGVLDHLKQKRIKVPQEISVIGYDNIDEAANTTPPLTTIQNSLYESGFETVKLLNDHISDPSLGIQIKRLPTKIILRDSCAKKKK